MSAVFWLCWGIIFYTYAGYPLGIALLARIRPRSRRRTPWTSDPTQSPPISVIMAVHNGASVLAPRLEHLLSLDQALIREIIVVSDGSTDATPAILENAASSLGAPSRLQIIVLPQHAGKAAALNHGMSAALGEILLFVDVRPHVTSAAIRALLANFAEPNVGCVAGELVLTTDGHDGAASAVSGLYWRYEQWMRNSEAAFDSPVGVYGGFYAIRRSLATTIPPGTILDDMFQPLSVIRQGFRSVVDRTAYVTDTWPAKVSGEFQRKVRTLAGNYQLVTHESWTLTPRNPVFIQLVSHKILRLIVPYCFLLLLITAMLLSRNSTFFLVSAALQSAFWVLAAVSLRVQIPLLGRVAAPAGALLMLNAAAIAGLYTFLFTPGPLWKIWSPTAIREDARSTLKTDVKHL